MIRVLIADDQEMVRAGFRMILETQDDIEVVADVPDGVSAVRMARELRPDVCLLDIRMPGMDGLEVTKSLAGPGVVDPLKVVGTAAGGRACGGPRGRAGVTADHGAPAASFRDGERDRACRRVDDRAADRA
jgi:DNA-binding LytR/AlgR family response regulator